jgi:superoxide reductase
MNCETKFFYCERCGNLVGLVEEGPGKLVCCGEPMVLLVPGTSDASQEKHVPVVSIDGDTVTVKVGSAPHPMVEEHLINWIFVRTERRGFRYILKAGEAPEATFLVPDEKVCAVYAYCNLHGLWKAAL